MFSFEFTLKTKVSDPTQTVRVIGHWMKAKVQIEELFPNVANSVHFRSLTCFGMKAYWCDDWITKIHSLQTIGTGYHEITKFIISIQNSYLQ